MGDPGSRDRRPSALSLQSLKTEKAGPILQVPAGRGFARGVRAVQEATEKSSPFGRGSGQAYLFKGAGGENPFRELGQPVQRGDRLDLLSDLLRERAKPLDEK